MQVAKSDIKPRSATGNMRLPEGEPLAVSVDLDFRVEATREFDTELLQTVGGFDFVQTVYVDNSQNAAALTLRFPSGQRLVIPATGQGYYPVVAHFGKFEMIATTTPAALLVIPIILLNVPVSSQQWGPITVNVAQVVATFTPTGGTFANSSGTIALGGTSQALFAANAAAIRRIVQNPPNNISALLINFGGVPAAAGNSISLAPGQTFDTGTGPIDRTAWTINGGTTAMAYIAKEMT